MGIKCFMCKKRFRSEKFPWNLAMWKPQGYWLPFDFGEGAAWFSLCAEHYEWCLENPTAAQVLLGANISAIAKGIVESESEDSN